MAYRTDRPDLGDHDDVGEDVDGAGHGSAGAQPGPTRYKQVRRRADGAPLAPEAVAETNRMKRTRRRAAATSGATTSADAGMTGSASSARTGAGAAAAGKAPAGKAPAGKAPAGRVASGKSGKAASGQGPSGQARPVDPEAADSKAPDRVEEANTLAKAAADIPTRRADVSAKWAVDRLDQRERRISFAAAGAAVLFGITIYISETHDKKFHLAKNQLTPEWTLILGIAAGALLFGATLLGRRAPVGFVALIAGAMFTGSSIVFGLPFIAVALFILYRSYKVQKEMSASVRAARAARAESRPPSSTSRASGASTRGSAASARGGKTGTKVKGPATPEANKRFTPKRPPPPPPKPTRRERKAAQASD